MKKFFLFFLLFLPAVSASISEDACITPPNGLVSWWSGDGNAQDIQENNHGIQNFGATFAPGFNNQAFNFNFGNVVVLDNASLRPNEFAIDTWIKADALETFDTILMKSTDGSWTDGYGISYYNNQLNFFINHYTTYVVSAPLSVNEWTHVTASYNGSTLKIYINGTLMDSETVNLNVSHSNNVLLIGQGTGSSGYSWDGLIDELEFFNRSLTQEEIQNIVDAGREGKCKIEEQTLVNGKITLQDKITPVQGASVDVECNGNIKNYPSTTSEGSYAVIFGEEECDEGDLATVTATKDSMAGTNSGVVENDLIFPELVQLDLNVAIINVAIPEFTTVTALLAILGATGFFVYKRRR